MFKRQRIRNVYILILEQLVHLCTGQLMHTLVRDMLYYAAERELHIARYVKPEVVLENIPDPAAPGL